MGLSKGVKYMVSKWGEARLRNYGRLGVDKSRLTVGTVAGAVEVGKRLQTQNRRVFWSEGLTWHRLREGWVPQCCAHSVLKMVLL